MKRALIGLFFGSLAAPSAAAVEYTGKNYPDPFADLKAPGAQADPEQLAAEAQEKLTASLKVQGVVVSPDGNMAIINGKVTRVGNMLAGYQVSMIKHDGVILSRKTGAGAQKIELPFKRKIL